MKQTKIALVDDHRVVRQGLRSFLESYADLTVIGMASSGEEALRELGKWQVDVVLMDLLLPGGISGIETTRRIKAQLVPAPRVIVLTGYTDDARVVGALRAGAISYIRKDAEPEMLLKAVRAAAQGQATFDASIPNTVIQEALHSPRLQTKQVHLTELIAKLPKL